jgi:type I restriction enzyme R subunit
VDYWGVSEALQEALAIFAPTDVKGAMTPKGDELPRLQARHAATLRFFVRVKDKDDLEACVAILEPEDVRAEFDEAFRRFSESLNMMLPDPCALPYAADARWLGKIRSTAAAKYRDEKLDISDCGAKVRELIEEAVIAEGIQILVKQVSLFTPEFEEKLKALRTEAARASEMEHAIKNEIHVKLEEDPAFYSSLRERLEKLIEDRKAKRIDAAQQLKLFEALRTELRGHNEVAESLGMSETSFAIYGLIAEPKPMVLAEPRGPVYGAKVDEAKKELAEILEEQLAPQVGIVDWATKDEVLREMRRLIKRQLKAASVPETKRETMAESIVDLMKRRRPR